jgi:hypothetical protein
MKRLKESATAAFAAEERLIALLKQEGLLVTKTANRKDLS